MILDTTKLIFALRSNANYFIRATMCKVANQLLDYKTSLENKPGPVTTGHGVPIGKKDASLTVGEDGPILLHDIPFTEEIAHFVRERIPERVVHAKGGGALGCFEVTHDISQYTAASVFSEVGKETKIAVRFSTVGGESGSADTVRDARGFSVKFYAEDGIWDLVGNNSPVFFIRDPVLFPHLVHVQKRNPVTHCKDPNMFWDFKSLRPESTLQILFLFSDRGIPKGYRHMNGFGVHAFKFVAESGEHCFCKFHLLTNQGIKNLDAQTALNLCGSDPDFANRDLYNAIAAGSFPSWTMHVQIMTPDQASKFQFNPFDATKLWPKNKLPLQPVGKLTLLKNPTNYFAEIEQLAFSPGHLIPGIQASPDRLLLGRILAYGDAHRYRLGSNYLQLPVNAPCAVTNYQRDGAACFNHQGGAPNYHPNSFCGPDECPKTNSLEISESITGKTQRFDTTVYNNFTQASMFYQTTLDDDEKDRLALNIANSLKETYDFIQKRALKNFEHVDVKLAEKIAANMKASE